MLELTLKNNPTPFDSSIDNFIYEGEFSATSEVSDTIIIPLAASSSIFQLFVESGTATLEYSLDTLEKIELGAAVWNSYSNADDLSTFATTDEVIETMQGIKAIRFTAIAGTSRIVISSSYAGGDTTKFGSDIKLPKLIDGRIPVDVAAITVTTGDVNVDVSTLATHVKQDVGNVSLDSIDTKLSSQATAAKQDTGNTSLGLIDVNLGAKADASATTDIGTFSLIALFKRLLEKLTAKITVVVDSSALPTGAATSVKQDIGNTSLNLLDVNIGAKADASATTDIGTFSIVSLFKRLLEKLTAKITVLVDNFPATQIVTFSGLTLDAGSRLRVSQLTTLGDFKTLNHDDTVLFENTGTGLGTWANNKYSLAVTAGQYFIRRSKQYYQYYSGKAQVVEITFDNFESELNTTKRVGYFSSNAVAPYDTNKDGFWLENTGTTIDLVVSRYGVETLRKNITDWDGYSLLSSYDWSMFTVIVFDYLWLGGAVLRLFVKTDLGFVLAHTFNYSGTSTDTFTKSPNQCLRYEIRSTTGTGSLRSICAQIATEGSVAESGSTRSINTGDTAISFATIGTTYPVKAICKKTTSRDSSTKIVGGQLYVLSNSDVALATIQLNPTLSAPITYSDIPFNGLREANGDGVITVTSPGVILASKYITQDSVMDSRLFEQDYTTWLGMSIGDVSDQIIMCITPLTATISAAGVIDYREF